MHQGVWPDFCRIVLTSVISSSHVFGGVLKSTPVDVMFFGS